MEKTLSRDEMLAIMERRDSSFDNRFLVGVRTMKIFCLVSCKAKLPLHKNVVFFTGQTEAENAGYRACRRCKPDRPPGTAPAWLDVGIQYLLANLDRRVSDVELAKYLGVDASTVRRHFKAKMDRTPAAFHRDLRLENAARRLLRQTPVLQVSEETGFESLSGFATAFQRKFGVTPGKYADA